MAKEDETRERVAKAMWEAENPDLPWDDYDEPARDDYRRLADAALVALGIDS